MDLCEQKQELTKKIAELARELERLSGYVKHPQTLHESIAAVRKDLEYWTCMQNELRRSEKSENRVK